MSLREFRMPKLIDKLEDTDKLEEDVMEIESKTKKVKKTTRNKKN